MLLGVANGAAAPGESRAEAVGAGASPGGAGLWRRFAGGLSGRPHAKQLWVHYSSDLIALKALYRSNTLSDHNDK